MKKLLQLKGLVVMVALTSCVHYADVGPRGPMGPSGPKGPAGAPGENGYVFEYTNVNFTSPGYEVVLSYPDDFEGLASDVALVYLLWEVQEIEGEFIEVWRPLPQTVFTNSGLLQYNFDYTQYDVRLFLDAEFSLDRLGAMDTDEWVGRVVVVPGDFWNGGRIIAGDYSELEKALGLPALTSHTSAPTRK